jgi:transmembrane sensor
MSSKDIEIKACEWLARLDAGEANMQLREELSAWRAADPRHEVAYLRIKAGWNRLDRLRALRPAPGESNPDLLRPAEAAAANDEVKSVPTNTRRPRPLMLIAAAILLAISIGTWALFASRQPVYTTGVGGFQRIQLSEGSLIELNTDTQVRVSFDRAWRRIDLVKGEARFTVAHDAKRPFVVNAGDTAVRALGTTFNVRRELAAVEVVVTEGKVAVGETTLIGQPNLITNGPASPPIISAGQAASVARGQLQRRKLEPAEAERELSWASGMLLFEGNELEEVVEEFNRYNARRLEVVDPTLGSLKVGGYFKATNLDAFVNVLRKDFGIEAVEKDGRIVLRRPDTE